MKSAPRLLLPLLLGLPSLQAQKLPDELHPIQGKVIQVRLLSADANGNLRVQQSGADKPTVVQLASLRSIRLGGSGRASYS